MFKNMLQLEKLHKFIKIYNSSLLTQSVKKGSIWLATFRAKLQSSPGAFHVK